MFVVGVVQAWEEVPNIFPLLLLPIERAFQPEKGSSSVCRVAAVDALTVLCMRSSVSTTHLLDQGLAKLLFKCLEVDEAIEESWEGCIGVLRAIACCVSAPSSVRHVSLEYWQGSVRPPHQTPHRRPQQHRSQVGGFLLCVSRGLQT